ncbi:ABC transporter ATP-binding protein [Actinomyces israelii]|uniref:ABC transporter ATP-binding protein n=1 Tax=Actinomyces israelii TaxID=1659 RepID=A0ABT4IDG7_9ACTO|nr:ABC transporter ATP-binding protein [Actinomyces israelii]MCZ0859302.1 ABC transporter ATP-binding protein [Actinomyces israelii]WKR20438.1 Putative HMP/thiamine import ATP-binding proteinYkoD [Actinomyces israelii]
MITISQAAWQYATAEKPTMEGVDLVIEPGETVVLCGASGSGKSTLLRMMNGLIPHFHEGTLSGRVTVSGLDVRKSALDELGRRTGTVLQHPRRQFFTATVIDELSFALENFGAEPADIRARVNMLMRRLALQAIMERPLPQLSGGQQQRVAIAAGLGHEPRALLLDEPSSNLSADAVSTLAGTLAELRERGITIVISEHRLHYLTGIADRFVLLERGRIAHSWTAQQLAALEPSVVEQYGLRSIEPPPLPELSSVPAAGASIAPTSAGAAVRPPAESGSGRGGLQLEDVRCVLKGRTVLSIDTAYFPAGAVTAVCGPNGAGKTTLARVVAGLQTHTGTIRLNGEPLSKRQRLRVSGIVMQDVQRQLFADSVRAEIELAATRAGSSRTGPTDDDVDRLLDELDLLPFADQHPLALSGGQQQRLVIAGIRQAEARIVIYDEPSSGVDRRHLDSIARAIRRSARAGAVVLLITHDDELLQRAADVRLDLRPPASSDASA